MTEKTLGDLISKSEAFDLLKEDYRADEWDLAINDDMQFVATHGELGYSMAPMDLTENALNQLSKKTGSIITTLSAQRLVENEATRPHVARAFDVLRAQTQENERKVPWLLRSYDGHCRAVLSIQYASTPNTELLQIARDGVEAYGKERGLEMDGNSLPMGRSTITPDDLYGYVTVKYVTTEEGKYGAGFVLRNNETGRGGLKLLPYIKRTSCDNSCVFDTDNALDVVHRGSGHGLLTAFAVAVGNALTLSYEGLETFLNARQVPLELDKEINALKTANRWTDEFAASVAIGTEGHHSLFGLINGVTYAAHHVYGDNPETMMAMETFAGHLLSQRMDIGRDN